MSADVVLSVSQLNRYVKSIIEQDANLQTVFVKGEISNFTNHYRTGHYYMTVKDDCSSVKAVMFKSANSHLRFLPENSMNVIIKGRVSVYERDGQYQLYIDDMIPDGTGDLAVAFEQLKKKLGAQGLFDQEKKKKIPQYPDKIGVVTSATGAAVHDIINVVSRRYPIAEIVLCPVEVQGENAASQIKAAIELFNEKKAADVLIVGRGGGSAEDLWAFNEEEVARAIYASNIPVISAVGHETDFTICDFVADLRAPTPSAAAELAVPDGIMQKEKIYDCKARIDAYICEFINEQRVKISRASSVIRLLSPKNYIDSLRVRCDKAVMSMDNSVRQGMIIRTKSFSQICTKLDAMSPLKILARGYGVVIKDGKIIKNAADVRVGETVDVRVANGEIECDVIKIRGQ